MPRSATSEHSSGGVCASADFTAATMPASGSCSASRISLELIVNMRGTPSARLRPEISISLTSPCGNAQPICSLIRSAVDSPIRSEEHTSELQSLMLRSYVVFCLKKKKTHKNLTPHYLHK